MSDPKNLIPIPDANRAEKHWEIRNALVALVGLTEDQATEVVKAIAKGSVPHVSIAY